MYTDPTRIHPTDRGHIEGNPVFIYHDAFNKNKAEVEDLKERYQAGQVGDIEVKEKLAKAINEFLKPIRLRRARYEKQKDLVEQIISQGSKIALKEAQQTLLEVKKAMGLV
jgi:tryptophanyl-tRNA synthetase